MSPSYVESERSVAFPSRSHPPPPKTVRRGGGVFGTNCVLYVHLQLSVANILCRNKYFAVFGRCARKVSVIFVQF
jgi:hypothetical protein